MYCRNCGLEIDNQAVVCVHCGVPTYKGKDYCKNCGKTTMKTDETCIQCGISLVEKGKDKSTALLFIYFTCYFGVFTVNYTGSFLFFICHSSTNSLPLIFLIF